MQWGVMKVDRIFFWLTHRMGKSYTRTFIRWDISFEHANKIQGLTKEAFRLQFYTDSVHFFILYACSRCRCGLLGSDHCP